MRTRGVAFWSIALIAIEAAALVRLMLAGEPTGGSAPAAAYVAEAFPTPKLELADATWSVDPADPGTNLPPAGRSLFDALTSDAKGQQSVLFPFDALLEGLARRAQCRHTLDGAWRECYRAVLIPLGRSLQRTAAGGEYFKYPRLVYAMDADHAGEPGAALAKDRLYLGYHEKSNVLEVISYNEAAGRFEFQLVKDYRAGGAARVFYANRAICSACHQNQAPIFSRQVWDETNANRAIASRLAGAGSARYGVELDRGVEVPQAIDNATDRANLLAAYQLLWRRGCAGEASSAIACRASILLAALQYRLSGESGFERSALREAFEPVTESRWRAQWPNGLLVPNADIPNRDPLQLNDPAHLQHVGAAFDPLSPRPHSERWRWETDRYRAVKGVGEFLSDADIRALDDALAAQVGEFKLRTYRADCVLQRRTIAAARERLSAQCEGADGLRVELRVERGAQGGWGVAEGVSFPEADTVARLDLLAEGDSNASTLVFRAVRGALHARRADGNLIARVSLQIAAQPARAALEVSVREDFAPLRGAVAELAQQARTHTSEALDDGPFRRDKVMSALFASLGLPPRAWCCDASQGPAPGLDDAPVQVNELQAQGAEPELTSFYRFCGRCHEGSDRSPPNFLGGDTRQVAKRLRACAERVYYRLSMWGVPESAREKSPMPPMLALRTLTAAPQAWPHSGELAALTRYAAGLAEQAGGARAAQLLQRPYESLAPCAVQAG